MPPLDLYDVGFVGVAGASGVVQTFPIYGDNGYTFGGADPQDSVQEYVHGTTTESADKGQLMTVARDRGASAQTFSVINCFGGNSGSTLYNVIDEYVLGSSTAMNDKGDLTTIIQQCSNQCWSSTHAYVLGGNTLANNGVITTIQEFEFGTGSGATNKSNLPNALLTMAGGTDATYSYTTCGAQPWLYNVQLIRAYQMGTTTTAVDKANCIEVTRGNGTVQTDTHMFNVGGCCPDRDTIDQYTFSTTVNSLDKSDLPVASSTFGRSQSSTHGYMHGGSGTGGGSGKIVEYEFGVTVSASFKSTEGISTTNCMSGGSGTP